MTTIYSEEQAPINCSGKAATTPQTRVTENVTLASTAGTDGTARASIEMTLRRTVADADPGMSWTSPRAAARAAIPSFEGFVK